MNFKKRSSISKLISKYVITGVFLFSSCGIVGCNKDNKKDQTPTDQIEPTEEEKKLQKQIEELQAQIAELQALNAEVEALKEQITTSKQQEIDALNSQIATLNNSLASLEDEITSLNNQIQTLENDNNAQSTTITNLQNQLNEATTNYNNLLTEKENLVSQVTELQAELAELYDITHYTVTFDSNKGSAVESQEVFAGFKIDKTKVSTTRKGYTFNGWKNGSVYWNMDEDVVTGPLTLKADWSANQYTITLNANEGSVSPTSYVATFDSNYTLPTPTRSNYTFLGWFDAKNNKVATSGKWTTTSGMSLTASWALSQGTITYIYNYDCDYPTVGGPFAYGGHYDVITPERTGYTFNGWKNVSTNNMVDSGTWEFVDNITVEALWTANTYTMTLNSGYGDPTEVSIVFDSLDVLPVCPDLSEDRPFAGWFIEGEKAVRLTDEQGVPLSEWKIAEDSTLVAKYFHPISTKEDFEKISENNSTIYSLVNDVDLNGVEQQESFEGTLWGLGYAITGLNWSSDDTNAGLFKTIKNATFEDISFKNDTICFTGNENSTYYIGLLASQGSGTNTFRNVSYSDIDISITTNNASVTVGGMVGRAGNLVLENVTSGGIIEANSLENSVNIGGFVGKCEGVITTNNYVNKANVIAYSLGGENELTHESFEGLCGGLVGHANTVDLIDTFNEGWVEGYSVKRVLSYTGGLIGKITNKLEVFNCANKGNIIATKYGGGIVGLIAISGSIQLSDIYNEGTLTDSSSSGVLGGLIGQSTTSLFLIHVYNKGSVSSTAGYSGGLIGDAEATCVIEESYNAGNVTSSKGTSGGLVGYGVMTTTVNDCYNTGTVKGEIYAGGLLGEIETYSAITNSYISGNVELVDMDGNGKIGGFVGISGNLDVTKSFIVATLKGINGNINSVIGEHSCGTESVKSAATFMDMSDVIFAEAPSYAQIIDSSLLTDSYIENTLHFNNTKWNFDHPSDPYPTLLYFAE